MKTLLPILLVGIVLISGCTTGAPAETTPPVPLPTVPSPTLTPPAPVTPPSTIPSSPTIPPSSTVTPGALTPPASPAPGPTAITGNYFRYDEASFNQALTEGKTIFLFFQANWCPLCAAQRPKILDAFDELNYADVIGFEAHYNDGETTVEDTALAQRYQVPYQDTKIVIDPTGTVVTKSQSHLQKEEIIAAIENARA